MVTWDIRIIDETTCLKKHCRARLLFKLISPSKIIFAVVSESANPLIDLAPSYMKVVICFFYTCISCHNGGLGRTGKQDLSVLGHSPLQSVFDRDFLPLSGKKYEKYFMILHKQRSWIRKQSGVV